MSMTSNTKLNIQAINQIGIVVRDLEKAVEHYWKDLGIGPWVFITLGPGVKKLAYHGEPCPHVVKAAMAQIGALQIELLEPVSGKSPHQDYLEQRGEGVQHLGIIVENLDQAAQEMKQLGYQEIMSAEGFLPNGEGAAIYFDTQSNLGTLLELIKLPNEMPAPEKIYPPPDK
jgi:methylmalonyl-CoA/ethylmalonyl-CoA epimerase